MCLHCHFFFQSISFNPQLHLPHHSFLQGGGTIWAKAHWHEWNKKNCFNMLARLFSNFFFQLDDSNDNWEREREREYVKKQKIPSYIREVLGINHKIDQIFRFYLQIWDGISQAHLTLFLQFSATEVTSLCSSVVSTSAKLLRLFVTVTWFRGITQFPQQSNIYPPQHRPRSCGNI